jgi:hypothetical protein
LWSRTQSTHFDQRHLQESISNRQDEQIPEINEFLSWQMSDDPDDNDDDDPEEQEENS